MKKKCLECVVLLLFIFALTHGIIQNTQPLKETKEVQTEYEEKTSQVTEKSQETEPEVQDLENQILRTASGKFFQKYPVDEAFMGWIETKYGSGVLQSLYTARAQESARCRQLRSVKTDLCKLAQNVI